MKTNFLQQMGIGVMVIGGMLLVIYSQKSLPQFNVSGTTVSFASIPDWVTGALLVGGLGLLILGTVVNIARPPQHAEYEEGEEDEEE